MLYQGILDEIVEQSKQIFGKELIGIYLHGSMAMGCFNPDKSDIDLRAWLFPISLTKLIFSLGIRNFFHFGIGLSGNIYYTIY